MARLGKMKIDLDIGPDQADNCHGRSDGKDILVFHETVSPDYKGLADIRGVSNYLDEKDYGIHSIIDLEAHFAWAFGYRTCIFYHTLSSGTKGNGNVNTRGIGLELISNVMTRSPDNRVRRAIWATRKAQLRKAAKLAATLNSQIDLPLKYSDGSQPGITTHWEVTHRFGVPGGHVDCWPVHRGGYFPIMEVIYMARAYKKAGY
jgi:N-acetylmuramoyl-L-alanine amidase